MSSGAGLREQHTYAAVMDEEMVGMLKVEDRVTQREHQSREASGFLHCIFSRHQWRFHFFKENSEDLAQ